MSAINSFLDLYRQDGEYGDCLIEPQRWCQRQWSWITSPLDYTTDPAWQVAKRITVAVLMILPTIFCYALGLLGVEIKDTVHCLGISNPPVAPAAAIPPTPTPVPAAVITPMPRAAIPIHPPRERTVTIPDSFSETGTLTLTISSPSFLETIDPLLSSAPVIPEVSSETRTPPADGACYLRIDFLSIDAFLCIAEFLGPRECIRTMSVSKDFKEIMSSNYIWRKYLTHIDYRIWHSLRDNPEKKDYPLLFSKELDVDNALEQLKAYHEVIKHHPINRTQFADFIARRMPGGPLAFKNLPQINPERVCSLKPSDMSASFMRGRDQLNNYFFALRIADQDTPPTVLVLKYYDSYIFDRQNYQNVWVQEANLYWAENTLKKGKDSMEEDIFRGYILDIIMGNDLSKQTRYNSPPFRNQVQLV